MAVTPDGLVVDVAVFTGRGLAQGAQIEDVEPPGSVGVGARDALLVGDPGAVGRQRGAFDVGVQGPEGSGAAVAADEIGLSAGGGGGVEAGVIGEGDAPDVDVGGADPVSADGQRIGLQVGVRAPPPVSTTEVRVEKAVPA